MCTARSSGSAVTLLFTDIVGSTRLWQTDETTMQAAMEAHDSIAADCVTTQGGRVVKNLGDGVFAAFASPTDAVAAARDLQRRLYAYPWPTETPIRVRIALHTGEVRQLGGDYHGPTVNRCDRLQVLAHGGQTLLSAVTAALVQDHLPEGVSVRDLGQHRLKDLTRPEHVYQLVDARVDTEFPPLRSLDGYLHNLPVQIASFVGREEELGTVRGRLGVSRLVTLAGPGGCGKTRLALQSAASLVSDYAGGVWLVELAPLARPEQMPQAIASAFHLKEQPGRGLLDTISDHLGSREHLVILDNCEHLVRECASTTEVLLRRCPATQVLATSREVLGVSGESVIRVQPLPVPPEDCATADSVGGYASVELFLDRASATGGRVTLDDRTAGAIAAICRRLEGIPLAIELAAARTAVLSLQQIEARLSDRLKLLTGGSRTAEARQQALRATIDWSYGLLGAEEQALFRRLAVFAGGFGIESAESVAAFEPLDAPGVLDVLAGLVNKSMVAADEIGDEARFRLLDTLRQYGLERLDQAAEADAVTRRYIDSSRAFAEREGRGVRGPGQQETLARLDREYANLRDSVEKTVAGGSRPDGLALCAALWHYWHLRGHVSEGRRYCERFLVDRGDLRPDPVLGEVLCGAAALAYDEGDYARAKELWSEAVGVSEACGDTAGAAGATGNLGNLSLVQADYASAECHYNQCLRHMREAGDARGIAAALSNLGLLAMKRGELVRANALLEESLERMKDAGGGHQVAHVLRTLGNLARQRGDSAAAKRFHLESIQLARELGDRRTLAHALNNLASVLLGLGDCSGATTAAEEGLALRRAIGDLRGVAASLSMLGQVHLRCDDHIRAARLFHESATTQEALGEAHSLVESLAGLALALGRMGQSATAAQVLESAEELARTRELVMPDTSLLTECRAELPAPGPRKREQALSTPAALEMARAVLWA